MSKAKWHVFDRWDVIDSVLDQKPAVALCKRSKVFTRDDFDKKQPDRVCIPCLNALAKTGESAGSAFIKTTWLDVIEAAYKDIRPRTKVTVTASQPTTWTYTCKWNGPDDVR